MIAIYFFFDFYDLNEPLCEQAYRICLGEKLEAEGYCDLKKFLGKTMPNIEIQRTLKRLQSPLTALYDQPPSDLEQGRELFQAFLEKEGVKAHYSRHPLNPFEAFALLTWQFKIFNTTGKRKTYIMELVERFNQKHKTNFDLVFAQTILYFRDQVDLRFVRSISTFSKELLDIEAKKEPEKGANDRYFFRGHSEVNHILKPSLKRDFDWLKNEQKMYQELMIRCSSYFSSDASHLERLVLMQHYGLPTRLLDITKNPLVALYFACQGTEKFGEVIMMGISQDEIKYSQSDIACVLASLPLLDYEEQKRYCELSYQQEKNISVFNEQIERLLHEIKSEKPHFLPNVKPADIRQNIVVTPVKSNDRIINQEGAFVLCGLSREDYIPLYDENQRGKANSLNYLRVEDRSRKKQIILCSNKSDILAELDRFTINKAKLFPEIDDVADYIKNNIKMI